MIALRDIGAAALDGELGNLRVGFDGVGGADVARVVERQVAHVDDGRLVEPRTREDEAVADAQVQVGLDLEQQVVRDHLGIGLVGGVAGVLGLGRLQHLVGDLAQAVQDVVVGGRDALRQVDRPDIGLAGLDLLLQVDDARAVVAVLVQRAVLFARRQAELELIEPALALLDVREILKQGPGIAYAIDHGVSSLLDVAPGRPRSCDRPGSGTEHSTSFGAKHMPEPARRRPARTDPFWT